MIEPCSYCIGRHRRNTNVFAGCFRIRGYTVDEKCSECHKAGGIVCLGAVPPALKPPPSNPIKYRPISVSQEACHGTFETSLQTFSKLSSSITTSLVRSDGSSSIGLSQSRLRATIPASFQSPWPERSTTSCDTPQDENLVDVLSGLTIKLPKDHQNIHRQTQGSKHTTSTSESSVTLVQQSQPTRSTQPLCSGTNFTLHVRSRSPTVTEGHPRLFSDSHVWKDIGVDRRKVEGKKATIQSQKQLKDPKVRICKREMVSNNKTSNQQTQTSTVAHRSKSQFQFTAR